MTTVRFSSKIISKNNVENLIPSLKVIVTENQKKISKNNNTSNNVKNNSRLKKSKISMFNPKTLFRGGHNTDDDDEDGDDDGSGEGAQKDKTGKKVDTALPKDEVGKSNTGIDNAFVGSSIHYVDACTLWKFPVWLVERLDCSKLLNNVENMHIQEIRRLVMHQLKATSTDLIMYATVRREFLRTILVIELNNVARILEVCTAMEIAPELKTKFFSSLQLCVGILENENKPYSEAFVTLAQVMDELYGKISPSVYFRELDSYDYNNIYCSYLIPGNVMRFTEMCCGGIIDNTWFSFEARYNAMVMVTPHVYDDPKGIQRGLLRCEKYRLEAYFDVDRGHYTAFDRHFKSTIPLSFRNNVLLEHLVFNFFSKNEHFVEEKNVFLMNGPETKGNLVFAKIYHSLVKTALL